ncbi:fluoride efflux transporter CrcB [Caldovatus aquaticus]|uniref:Fluoride-specific ion channel FluC n=1 Tax=Caldovatus aquaticus TaxID=2865671 RepID=A0ABS7F6B1_9PROT|nr:fluoride efflux transporter CrcB [Caldovatus aquaticus]MBW8271152.1 fluoride efflux transporter CrcB [Caldovatus aquaticus]
MGTYLAIGLGTALGGMARYWCSGAVARRWGERFPWGTLVVNLLGSFAIGLLAGLAALPVGDGGPLLAPDLARFAMAGLCGGFTTFSSVSLQTLTLAREGEWLHAAGNVTASVLLCLGAAWLGLAAASAALAIAKEA